MSRGGARMRVPGAAGGDPTTEPGKRRGPWRCRSVFLPILLFAIGLFAIGGCASVDPWQDARIEAEVKSRLVAERDANLTQVGVVSRNATVYLSGAVESADQRALAETVAKGVRGVRRVIDSLEVRSAPK